jgi:hypothetical protein
VSLRAQRNGLRDSICRDLKYSQRHRASPALGPAGRYRPRADLEKSIALSINARRVCVFRRMTSTISR